MFEHNDKNINTTSTETTKDFTPLIPAYAFFRKNSNEYTANKEVLIKHLSFLLKEGISILDFGGGDG